MSAVIDEWIKVSMDGFASRNAARPPEHLAKEIIQNAMDATSNGGKVAVTIEMANDHLQITCIDTGPGIEDFEDLRTMYWTSKKEGPFLRGRFGLGIKEILSMAIDAKLVSRYGSIEFYRTGKSRKVRHNPNEKFDGTHVTIAMPWQEDIIDDLVMYFNRFLPPSNIQFTVNGAEISQGEVAHTIEATLTTETFENGIWVKGPRRTTLELFHIKPGQIPTIYEMGIPVCDVEWDQNYHINVLQRVPMNPNRDSVMSGYPSKLHRACLPVLANEMTPDEVKAPWVGSVVQDVSEDLQKQIIEKGFGNNIVRSVPTMGNGRRDFDVEAKGMGSRVIETRLLTGGFSDIIRKHVPTTKTLIEEREQERLLEATRGAFYAYEAFEDTDHRANERKRLIDEAGGREHVEHVSHFFRWFINQLLNADEGRISDIRLGILPVEMISWGEDFTVTLALNSGQIWSNPFSEQVLTNVIGAIAAFRAKRHGVELNSEFRKLAGTALHVMAVNADYLRSQHGSLIDR